MKRISTFLFIATLVLSGCTGCEDQPAMDAPLVINKMEQRIELSDDYSKGLQESLSYYFDLMSEGDFAGYVEMVYPKVFATDSLKQQTIEMMENYAEQGFRNVTKDYKILYASRLIQDSLQKVCRVIVNVKHEIIFGEEFVGDPESFEGMVRNQFGNDTFTYNALERKYEIDGNIKLYAITPDEVIDFKYLNDQYTESRYLGDMLLYNTVFELKKIDSESGF